MRKHYVTYLYVGNGGFFTQIEAYVTDASLYAKFDNGLVAKGHPDELDEDLELHGAVLYVTDSQAWFQSKNEPVPFEIEIRKAYINLFAPFNEYSDEDIVSYGDRLFYRKYPGSSATWNPADWEPIQTGNELSILTLYKNTMGKAVPMDVPNGVFFWSERVELDYFHTNMPIFDGLRIYDDL